MRELYINGSLVDLYSKDTAPIATSYQINKVSEFKDVQASFSNTFSIPKTENNIQIIGNADLVNTNSVVPYRKSPARLINDGIDLVDNGFAIIEEAGYEFSITILSGNFDLFDQIGDKQLNDLDFSELDHSYTLDTIVQLNEDDGDVIWPLVQLGAYDDSGTIDIRWQTPALKYSYIFKKIFEGTTWGYSGEIFSENKFTKLLYQLLPEEITDIQAVLDTKSARIGTNGFAFPVRPADFRYLSMLTTGRFDVLTFPNFDSTAGYLDRSNANNYRYVARKQVIVDVELNLFFNYSGLTPFSIVKNGSFPFLNSGSGVVVYRSTGEVPIGQNYLTTTISVFLKAGENLEILSEGSSREIGAPLSLFYPDGTIIGQPSNKAFIKFTAKRSSGIGGEININTLLGDMKQADIIRNTCNLFGLLMQPNYRTNKIEFVQHKAISQSNNVVDWSDKIDTNVTPAISFRSDGFGRSTYMRWGKEDDRGSLGDGFFTIDDNVLENKEDLFVMDFNCSLQASIKDAYGSVVSAADIKRYTRTEADNYNSQTEYNQGDLAYYRGIVYEYFALIPSAGIIPTTPVVWQIYTLQFEQTEESSDRLLYYKKEGYFNVTDGEGNTTPEPLNWPLAYFADATKEYDLDFARIIENEYRPFVAMMQRYKEVKLNVRLNDIDINNLNFFDIVFIEYLGNKFYITLVDEYESDEPSTSCTLIRI